MRSYYTNSRKTEMAFVMPCTRDDGAFYKIVRQNQRTRHVLCRIMDKNFKTLEEAQGKLDKIAEKKGWIKAYESA